MGQPFEILLPESSRQQYASHTVSYVLGPDARPNGSGLDLFGLRKDGTEFPMEVRLSPLRAADTMLVSAIVRDVSEQRAQAKENQQAAVIDERHRMARDVHDTLAQGFAGVVVQLQAAESAFKSRPEEALSHITRARHLAQSNLGEARKSVLSLTEQQVETAGLAESVQELVARLQAETQIRLELSIQGTPRRLDASIEENLLGIARQAIDNAIQHSHANEIRVELAFKKTGVRLQVTDDGRGFEPSAVPRGFGLKSMKDRARHCGGKFELETKPGKGTRIAVAIRLRRPPGRERPA
jgi:signal transduction histidine kinase